MNLFGGARSLRRLIESNRVQNINFRGFGSEKKMTFLLNLQTTERLLRNISLDYPLTQNNINAMMNSFPQIYEPSNLPIDFYRNFEVCDDFIR